MSTLLLITLGPVQGFIASARRTRDLWFGSTLLSDVSKAAANALHQSRQARLIFPAPEQDSDLEPASTLNVANRILVEVTSDDPKVLATLAHEAAIAHWESFAQSTLDKVKPYIRPDIWDSQKGDVLEFSAAWVRFRENEQYSDALKRLERLAAARKTSRDFRPAACDPEQTPAYGLPKSSLDGLRETVLLEELSDTAHQRMGISKGEQLDCPGLVKRMCGDNPERFTPISRIALDSWLCKLAEQAPADLAKLAAAYEPLVTHDLATRDKSDAELFGTMPYDAQLLYPPRLDAVLQEQRRNGTDAAVQALASLRDEARPLWKKFDTPSPYVAMLQADGDRMGELLSKARNVDEHRAVSRDLSRFAQNVKNIVRNHRGACVYAGGDDVLALLPLDGVLDCAYVLQSEFNKALQAVSKQLSVSTPTLSVGVGIQHMVQPLGQLRALAKRAEQQAKGDSLATEKQRNSLCIIVQTRSGSAVSVRDQWSNKPAQRLQEWVRLFEPSEQLPDKAAYDLRRTARELRWAKNINNGDLLAAEAKRILARKRGERGQTELPVALINRLVEHARQFGLAALADELVVARWLAQRVKD